MSAETEYLEICRSHFADHSDSGVVARHTAAAAGHTADPMPLYFLADLCLKIGRPTLWLHGITFAFRRQHETHQSVYRRGLARLRLGDWSGWCDFEARQFNPGWGCSRPNRLSWAHRKWDGVDDLTERTLLILHQGGLGDDIFVFRFIAALADRVGEVILEVKPKVLSLAQLAVGHAATVITPSSGRPICEFDQYLWTLSLPYIVGTLPPLPHLAISGPASRPLLASPTLQIGVCWACSDTARDSLDRSVPVSAFATLFSRNDCRCHSLQVGQRASDVDWYPTLRRPAPPLDTLEDTAAFIAGLDCVVSVDTAVCHIAGYLGIPTFLLLYCAADWKWGLGETTPWYPSMRIIRQRTPGDWTEVIGILAAELDALQRLGRHEDRQP